MPDAAGESVAQLLESARVAGFTVSTARLRRWQQAGLLPKPCQYGLGQGRGTAVQYPNGTSVQLVRLCQLLIEKRSFPQVAWRLWWEGFQVPERLVRKALATTIKEQEEQRVALERLDQTDDDDAWNRLGRWGRGRLGDPGLRRIRKRVGRENFTDFIVTMIRVVTGTDVGPSIRDKESADMLAKGLGVTVTPEYKQEETRDEMRGVVQNALTHLSKILNHDRLKQILHSASDSELRSIRDELAPLLELLGPVMAMIGGGGFRQYAERIGVLSQPLHVSSHQGLFLTWMSARQLPEVQQFFTRLGTVLPALLAGQDLKTVLGDLERQEPM